MEKLNNFRKNYNGYVMHMDTRVVRINDNYPTVLNDQLSPNLFRKGMSLEYWLEKRGIDLDRINSRLLRKALGFRTRDISEIVLKVNGANLTDFYWFKSDDEENMKFSDIKFSKNDFFESALYGDIKAFNLDYSRTPELTNTGSYEKGWNLENHSWWLYKKGTREEIFSELFTYTLGKHLGFDMAIYKLAGDSIKSKNFVSKVREFYEPISHYIGEDNDDYTSIFNILLDINKSIALQYVVIIYLDTLVINFDRHNDNFGFIRNRSDGNIIRLAPNFDNNLSLISKGYMSNNERNDIMVKYFIEFLEDNKNEINPNMFERIGRREIEYLLDKTAKKCNLEIDLDFLTGLIYNAYSKIQEAIKEIYEN
jgi:hypothetical protein